MKKYLKVLVAAFALAVALPAVLLAQEKMTFKQLDPTMQKALQRVLTDARLKELGLDSFPQAVEEVSVQVTTNDCPADCNADVHHGMCYCSPQTGGGCKDGQEETTWGGKDMCKILPTTANLRGDNGRGSPLQVLMR